MPKVEKLVVKPIRGDAHYQGTFEPSAFGLLANPVPLYQNLLKHLGRHGAALNSLKYEAAVIGEANVACTLVGINTVTRVRLDRFEVTFLRLHEIGDTLAYQVLQDSWAAVHETDPTIAIQEYRLAVSLTVRIEGASCSEAIQRHVKIPEKFPQQTRAGVVFYTPENASKGEKQGSIVLDYSPEMPEEHMTLRLNINLAATQVPLNSLASRVTEYMDWGLDALGLSIDRSGPR